MARLDYYAPGVYVEEVDRGSRPIQGVPTAVGGFVGFTEDVRGGAELFKPMLVTNWNQYLQYFARPNSDGFTDFGAYLPFAVYGWFLNGGGRCWVSSIGTRLPGTDRLEPEQSGTIVGSRSNRPSLRFFIDPGADITPAGSTRSNSTFDGLTARDRIISIQIQDSEPKSSDREAAEESAIAVNTGEYFTILVKEGDTERERFENLTLNSEADSAVADYVVTKLEESEYIRAMDLSASGSPLARRPMNGAYEVSPPLPVTEVGNVAQNIEGIQEERTGVRGIFEVDEVTILACPDLMRVYQEGLIDLDQLHGLLDTTISLCEGAISGNMASAPNRMFILDAPPPYALQESIDDRVNGGGEPKSIETYVKPQQIYHWLRDEFNRRSQFAALYYPWIQVPNPRNGGRPIAIPPSGHMAGVWARTDETRGVYKAPANEVPRGVVGLTYDCNFREQELLNPVGINCIRPFPNRGIRVWGARTLVEPDKTEWRYISVRRLMSYIEKSVELGTQWAVFEPNDEDLWQRVKRTVSNFLTGLWRAGALFGGTPDEAFYVKCDRDLNTPDTIMLGRLYVEVGVAPVRPAEFVIFRFSQWTSEAQE